MSIDRRRFLLSSALTAALGTLPASIARALDIPADNRTGTIMDVQHVVILTQENRAFDHYFGTLSGVRGFSDRFPIPTVNGTVWSQPDEHDKKHLIAPFRLNTVQDFKYMRAEGTPHNFVNAQDAWDLGRLDNSSTITAWVISPARISLSSSPWPKPSRSATPITAPFMPAPIRTACSSGLAPMTLPARTTARRSTTAMTI
jgi:hypothetical protein